MNENETTKISHAYHGMENQKIGVMTSAAFGQGVGRCPPKRTNRISASHERSTEKLHLSREREFGAAQGLVYLPIEKRSDRRDRGVRC